MIDDTAIILQRLQAILSELKQVSRTEAVLSAEAALVMMDGYEPDVMVLDINMPGMSGIEMLKQMSGTLVKPVIIMLTNNTFAGYRDECMRLGAHYFLDKSRDFQLIPSIVEEIKLRNVFKIPVGR